MEITEWEKTIEEAYRNIRRVTDDPKAFKKLNRPEKKLCLNMRLHIENYFEDKKKAEAPK